MRSFIVFLNCFLFAAIAHMCACAAVALGQGASPAIADAAVVDQVTGWLQGVLGNWPQLAKYVAFMVALQIMLRALSEAILKFANYTDNTFDNKLANWLAEAAWVLGLVLSKFGYGTPKPVIEEKAAQQQQPPQAKAP